MYSMTGRDQAAALPLLVFPFEWKEPVVSRERRACLLLTGCVEDPLCVSAMHGRVNQGFKFCGCDVLPRERDPACFVTIHIFQITKLGKGQGSAWFQGFYYQSSPANVSYPLLCNEFSPTLG